MADETVTGTPAMHPGCSTRNLEMSEAIDAGEVAKISSNQLALAQAATGEATTDFDGVVVLGGASGQDAVLVTSGPIDPGFTVEPGATYYVSSNAAGKITKTLADLSGDGITIIGYGVEADKLLVKKSVLGVVGA